MHKPFLINQLGRWLSVLLLLVCSTGAWAQTTLINENFEGATNSFTVVNGSATNAWAVGTAATNGPTTTGTKAAYISNDAGVTYAYTTGSISVVHMYQDVTFPAGQTIIQLGLDWKGLGETNATYDNLQLFLVPTTATPTASNTGAVAANSRLQNSGFTPFATLTGQTAYSRSTITIPASAAGTTQRLVLQWYNDAIGGTNPPAAVDNILLTSAVLTPVCGTKSVGPTGDYASLTAAFTAINLNGLCGPAVLELQSSYVSTVETFPLVFSNTVGASATNTVTVRPAAGATGLSITGTGATAVMSIAGGKYLIIDGRPGGSGATVSGAAQATDLTISSTSTSGIPLQFTSDATFNTVQHVQVKGVGTSDSGSPDVNFTGTVTTTGNSDNTVQYCNIGDGATTPVTLIYGGNSLNARNSILNNNLFNNYGTGSTYGIYLNQSGAGWNITGNSLYQTANRVNVSGTMYGIYINANNGHTVSGNFIGGSAPNAGGTPLTITATTAAAYRFAGIFLATSTGTATNVQGNTIGNITWVSSSGSTTTYGILSGIYVSGGDVNIGTVTGNVIGGPTAPISVSTTSTGGYSFGISTASSGAITIANNTISNISGTGAATVASNVAGILASTGSPTISRNKVYNLAGGGGVGNISTGIWLTGGTTTAVSNNLIGDLRAATSTSLVAVSGIVVSGGTTHNVYYNTINLAATSSGATFGTSGIYLNSTSATLDLRNNLVVNKSTAVGTGGYTAALRRISGTAGTLPANLASTSNNNLYYAGTPSATNLIYVEGTTTATNASQTLAAYKALVSTRETLSQTEDVAFLSTSGTSASFLHINPAVPTLAEGKAQSISSISVDYDNDNRSSTTPDIGADEGTFITAAAAVDVAATGLIAPSTTGCYGATEGVVVSIRNNGTQVLDFAATPATVTVNVTGAVTQTLTTTVNTGTLAIGASQNVTVGTLNMSTAGSYSFAITATAPGDGDASNNTTTATRTKVAIATGPQQLNFSAFTGANLSTLYPGWYEATGLTLPSGTTSTWTNDDYANVVNGPNGISAKINLFSNTRNDWMVSPRVLATASSVLTYDLALTAFGATTTGTLGSDDRLEVRVSTDCGLTFTTIKSYTAATPISNTGQFENISLASYAGQEIIVAFFATEGTVDDANDNDVFIDNINLNPQTVDLGATALVSPTAGQTCYGSAQAVEVTVRNLGALAIDFAANPATVTVNVTGAVTQTLTTTVNTGTLAVGASQNVTLASTLDMSTAGTYTFAVSATATGDQNATNDALAPNVTRTVVAPVAGTATTNLSTLCVSGTTTLNLTSSANGNIQWQQSPDNVTFTDISGATATTFTTPVLNSTTYFRARTACGTTVATSNVITITISNPQVTGTNSPVAICEGSPATLTATAATGTTVRFFETATSNTALATGTTFTTPALTASRQYFVEASTGVSESVGRPAPAAVTNTTASTYGLVFTAASAFTLTSVDVYPAGSAGNLVVQVQDNTGALIPGLTATVAIPAGTGTTAFTVPLNFRIPAGTGLRLMAISSPSLVREASIGGFPYNSPSGLVSITNGYVSGTSTNYYFFYNWQVSNLCLGTRTAVQVDVTPAATAAFPTATATSCGASPYQLAGTVGGSATTGTYTSSGTGSFSPNATTLNATYTPSAADITAGSVTITLTSGSTAPCAAATATLALSISPTPVASFSYPAATTYCAGSASTVTPTLGTGASAGTFSSTTGLTIDATTGVITLSSSTAGTYTVTNTIAASGSCAAVSDTQTVTIAPATSATFNYSTSTLCLSGTNPTPTVTGTAGGTFSSTTGLSIDAATGTINLAASTAGTYVVTYTVAGACGSTATQTVTLTTAPVASFSYPASTTYCAGSASTVTPTLGTGASAGTFSSTAGLAIDPATGIISLSNSTAGTYTVTNTIAASGSCVAAVATSSVTITPGTSAAFSYGGATFCQTGTTAPTATVTGTAGGTFSSTTGLTLNATTGAITLSTSTPGTYTVTYTVAGTCGSSATQTVTITAAPVASFSYATTAGCAGSASTVTPTLGTGASAGTFSSTTGLSINATTGVITLGTSAAGTYTVTNTVAATGGCAAATATATFTVNPAPATPTVTVTYPTSGTALLSSSVAPAGTTYQWYLGTTAITGATGQTYTAVGATAPGAYTVRLINTATGCQSAASTTVTVTAAKNSIAGASLNVYPNPTPNGQMTLELTGFRSATQLTVLDALGRVVISQLLPANAGTATRALDLSGVATGVYLLRLSNTDGVETHRLVRE